MAALDERLLTAASLFPACAYGADIGADHGRLSCYLLENQVCQRMCVSDISAPSLQKAAELLEKHGLTHGADIRVGDGLSVLDREAQAIAVLGMGGHTIAGILERGRDRLCGAALILSAHTEVFRIRQALSRLHYRIDEEKIALSAGRFYVLIRGVPGQEAYTPRQFFLGPRLAESCTDHYPEYIAWQIQMTLPKRTEQASLHLQWLKEEKERVAHSRKD